MATISPAGAWAWAQLNKTIIILKCAWPSTYWSSFSQIILSEWTPYHSMLEGGLNDKNWSQHGTYVLFHMKPR